MANGKFAARALGPHFAVQGSMLTRCTLLAPRWTLAFALTSAIAVPMPSHAQDRPAPRRRPRDGGPPAVAPATAKLDLNRASARALMTLPGIGPKRAHAIIALRPLRHVWSLRRIRGLGPKRIRRLLPLATVHPLPGPTARRPTSPPRRKRTGPTRPRPTRTAASDIDGAREPS